MRTAKVTLGGQEYEVRELPARKNAAWREQLQKPFAELAGVLDMQALAAQELPEVVRKFGGVLLGAVDTVRELLLAYAPELAADAERIAEEAYDSEMLDAFVEVLKLAYPFGSWLAGLRTLAGSG